MAEIETRKKEIIEYVTKKHSKSDKLSKIISKVKEELDVLGSTDGLEAKNNLEVFYNIWKSHKGKVGHKNDINSWTAFFLGLTKVKPDKDFLPTRRAFARAGFPDIDTDFDYESRDSVYTYIIDKYGRDNVGNIGTHGLLRFKSCVTRVTKALDLANAYHKGDSLFVSENAAKVTEILSPFPKKGLLKVTDEDGESHLIKTFEDAYAHCSDFKHYVDKYKDSGFKKYMEQIEGTFANFGCLAKDTPILTDGGWKRIDQLSTKFSIAYINKDGEISYTDRYKAFKTGRKKVYRLKLKDGRFIDVTDEHLIFTDKGCVKFEEIRKNKENYKIYGIKKDSLKNDRITIPAV